MRPRNQFCGALLISALFAQSVQSADPLWWNVPETRIWSGTGAPSDPEREAPARIGQLKHVAARARSYLDLKLAHRGGAGAEIAAMVNGFAVTGDDAAPANVGQLKVIAAPFYRRLGAVGLDVRPTLIAHAVNAQSSGYAAQLAAQSPPIYPWAASAPPAEEEAPCSIGQLQHAFAFDLNSTLTFLDSDTDGDGLCDGWECWHFGDTAFNVASLPLEAAPAAHLLPQFASPSLVIEQDGDDTSLVFTSIRGFGYQLQSSPDLKIWSSASPVYYGSSQTFEAPLTLPNGSGGGGSTGDNDTFFVHEPAIPANTSQVFWRGADGNYYNGTLPFVFTSPTGQRLGPPMSKIVGTGAQQRTITLIKVAVFETGQTNLTADEQTRFARLTEHRTTLEAEIDEMTSGTSVPLDPLPGCDIFTVWCDWKSIPTATTSTTHSNGHWV